MLITTTPNIEGKQIIEYKEVVFGEVVAGSNFIRDFFAGITDIIGGRSGAYESKIARARKEALEELQQQAKRLGANAVVGIEVNYTSINGEGKSMFMIVASGTAVVVR
ncbi:YbjQ family protein [Pasteurella multocida]|uniref:YbjQ family protein n=1 Tax=Pasteurella multocida TaxID=747 RepID=UPI000DFB8C0F|nr:YbjQ family protein [Pasteurella multocida]MEB3478151.1 YbjQ family protein [Pasteurella multocida]MEB3479885.1 YbjQ family protein [Pasteurella multocida]MEB3492749.1 YbjQ family protein [Pasteurella multocida]MEB3496827.1 YbjQ family protein [Pasteurella multocida]MEB3500378.1 YbjQ family protein [Pasteurella multocida]